MKLSRTVQLNPEECKGCYLCIDLCPNDLFQVDTEPNASGHYPVKMVRGEYCINCMACVDICPDQAFEKPEISSFNWVGRIYGLSYRWFKR